MDEKKEPEKIAESFLLRGTQTLTAKNILEFDKLMVCCADFIEMYPTYTAKVTVDFAKDTYVPDCTFMTTLKNQIVATDVKSKDSFLKFISQIRKAENDFLLQIAKPVVEGEEPSEPIYNFSCTVALKIETKDKEAKEKLDNHQLEMFAPMKPVEYMTPEERALFIAQHRPLFEGIMPDGKNVTKVTFQKLGSGGGEPIELKG